MKKIALIISIVYLSNFVFSQGFQTKDTITGNEKIRLFNEPGGNKAITTKAIGDYIKDSAEWIDGSKIGLTPGNIYSRKALVNGDTLVVNNNGHIGVGTNTPDYGVDILEGGFRQGSSSIDSGGTGGEFISNREDVWLNHFTGSGTNANATLQFQRAMGTKNAPYDVPANTPFGAIHWRPFWNGSFRWFDNFIDVKTTANPGTGITPNSVMTFGVSRKYILRLLGETGDIRAQYYPNTRIDTNAISNILYTTTDGTIQSQPIDSLKKTLLTGAEWISNSDSTIFANKALLTGDTVVFDKRGYLGMGTSTPTSNLDLYASPNNRLRWWGDAIVHEGAGVGGGPAPIYNFIMANGDVNNRLPFTSLDSNRYVGGIAYRVPSIATGGSTGRLVNTETYYLKNNASGYPMGKYTIDVRGEGENGNANGGSAVATFMYNKSVQFNKYGLGNLDAISLAKTPSNYISAFATDGTIIELNIDSLNIKKNWQDVINQQYNDDGPGYLYIEGENSRWYFEDDGASLSIGGDDITFHGNNYTAVLSDSILVLGSHRKGELRIFTPKVDDNTAQNGDILTLLDSNSGKAEFISIDSLLLNNSTFTDSSEWIDGSKVGLTPGNTYARKALLNGDTLVISKNGYLGMGTSTPSVNLDLFEGTDNRFRWWGDGIVHEGAGTGGGPAPVYNFSMANGNIKNPLPFTSLDSNRFVGGINYRANSAGTSGGSGKIAAVETHYLKNNASGYPMGDYSIDLRGEGENGNANGGSSVATFMFNKSVQFNHYGIGNFDAISLAKTPSNFISAFATDGTITELSIDTLAKQIVTVTDTTVIQNTDTLQGLRDYSTTEQWTGQKWINGKKIYRIVIPFQQSTLVGGEDLDHNLNIDRYLSQFFLGPDNNDNPSYLTAQDLTDIGYMNGIYNPQPNTILLEGFSTLGQWYCILEYTKN